MRACAHGENQFRSAFSQPLCRHRGPSGPAGQRQRDSGRLGADRRLASRSARRPTTQRSVSSLAFWAPSRPVNLAFALDRRDDRLARPRGPVPNGPRSSSDWNPKFRRPTGNPQHRRCPDSTVAARLRRCRCIPALAQGTYRVSAWNAGWPADEPLSLRRRKPLGLGSPSRHSPGHMRRKRQPASHRPLRLAHHARSRMQLPHSSAPCNPRRSRYRPGGKLPNGCTFQHLQLLRTAGSRLRPSSKTSSWLVPPRVSLSPPSSPAFTHNLDSVHEHLPLLENERWPSANSVIPGHDEGWHSEQRDPSTQLVPQRASCRGAANARWTGVHVAIAQGADAGFGLRLAFVRLAAGLKAPPAGLFERRRRFRQNR